MLAECVSPFMLIKVVGNSGQIGSSIQNALDLNLDKIQSYIDKKSIKISRVI